MSKFEAILPLSPNQNALLTHHIISDNDLGEIWVDFKVNSALDKHKFENAFRILTRINPSIRSTVHWENIEHPVQIVHHYKEQKNLSWSNEERRGQEFVKNLRQRETLESDFITKFPRESVWVNSESDQSYQVVWRVHHLFLDGWSTAQLINEWADIYNSLCKNEKPNHVPKTNMKSFLSHVESITEEAMQSLREDIAITKNYSSIFHQTSKISYPLGVLKTQFESAELIEKSRELGISLASLYKGAFALCLHGSFLSGNALFGLSTSGRNTEDPQINALTGMLSGLVPVFSSTESKNLSTQDYLAQIHRQSSKESSYSTLSLDQIQAVCNEKGMKADIETSLTIENFPWSDINLEHISISDFSSGLTTNFPLNLVIIPSDKASFTWLYSTNHLDKEKMRLISRNFEEILDGIVKSVSLDELLSNTSTIKMTKASFNDKSTQLAEVSNNTQFKLLQIWQKELKLPIDLDDNFFELGGKSIHIIRIFNEIQKRFKRNLAPALILEHPTVRSLSKILESESDGDSWTNLVPLSISSSKNYVFCIHAGGAHVFIYREFAQNLAKVASVIGIQAPGLGGNNVAVETIQKLAQMYLDQILETAGEKTKIFIVAYCFSASVTLEIGRLMEERQIQNIELIIVDSAPGLTYGREVLPFTGRIRKMSQIIKKGEWRRIRDMIYVKLDRFKAKWLRVLESKQMKSFRATEAHLAKLYEEYSWPIIDKEIHLIRSSEFAKRSDKDIHVAGWKKLSSGRLKICEINGPHFKLFEKPYVKGLADQVLEIIKDEI